MTLKPTTPKKGAASFVRKPKGGVARTAETPPPNYDYTVKERMARHKADLLKTGGRRMSLNLEAAQVTKLDALIKANYASDFSSAIRKLIDAKKV